MFNKLISTFTNIKGYNKQDYCRFWLIGSEVSIISFGCWFFVLKKMSKTGHLRHNYALQ
jgi:hypothetical protein